MRFFVCTFSCLKLLSTTVTVDMLGLEEMWFLFRQQVALDFIIRFDHEMMLCCGVAQY